MKFFLAIFSISVPMMVAANDPFVTGVGHTLLATVFSDADAGTINNPHCDDFGFDFGFKEDNECNPGSFVLSNLAVSGSGDKCQGFYDDVGEETITVRCYQKNGEEYTGTTSCQECPFALVEHSNTQYNGYAKVKSGNGNGQTIMFETLGVISSCDSSVLQANIPSDHDWSVGNKFSNGWEATGQTCQGISHLEFCFNCGEEPDGRNGGSFGDPHFKTWNGEYFDFMGQCDLVLAESIDFGEGVGMVAHVRTKIRYDYSFIESAALKIGDDVLEVGAYGSYLLDGVSNAELPLKMAGQYSLTKKVINDHDVSFIIEINKDEHIVLKAFKDLVSIQFNNAQENNFADVVGMMGSIQNGTKLSRDGLRVIDDDNEFGLEWQVRPGTDPELFQVGPFVRYPTQCAMPNPVKEERRRLGETISVEAATAACRKHFSTRAAMEACIYDIIATGDLEAANAGAF